jgi:hypothetical protein
VVADARREIDDEQRARSRPARINFIWVPRRFNAAADEAATAAILQRAPNFDGLNVAPEIPRTFTGPTQADLEAVARGVLSGAIGPSWRSVPPSLRTLWHSILGVVSGWGPWAVFLAPVVLLRRATDSPAKRLQQLALDKNLLAQYYWHAANDSHAPPGRDPGAMDEATFWKKVERRAAHARRLRGAWCRVSRRHRQMTPPPR